jgi:hypothetical protein
LVGSGGGWGGVNDGAGLGDCWGCLTGLAQVPDYGADFELWAGAVHKSSQSEGGEELGWGGVGWGVLAGRGCLVVAAVVGWHGVAKKQGCGSSAGVKQLCMRCACTDVCCTGTTGRNCTLTIGLSP